ncbi:MAG: hypothetical protein R3343_10520 [Nitriliruptorales bacterium]|nr:hypothetical protein [Nitriliruptorales bacterium]
MAVTVAMHAGSEPDHPHHDHATHAHAPAANAIYEEDHPRTDGEPSTSHHGIDHDPSSSPPTANAATAHGTGAHGDSEGLKLVAQTAETVTEGSTCDSEVPRRTYEIVSLAVDITLNRYLDHDPEGRMYALASEVDNVRAEERANAAARTAGGQRGAAGRCDPAVDAAGAPRRVSRRHVDERSRGAGELPPPRLEPAGGRHR